MKSFIAMFLVLCAAASVLAQTSPPPGQSGPAAAQKEADALAPPPYVNTLHGRPVYRVNEDIRPPAVIIAPDPPPLKGLSAATVVLWCIVGIDGKAHLIKVARHNTLEADIKAVENLKQWKFSPAVMKKANTEVDVLTKVEVVWR
jgi:hypothetical protein